MEKAKSGDTVKVHYEGKLDDGTVFDKSDPKNPLQFKIGDGSIIPGFERSVAGMTVGEKKTIKIDSKDAYGPHQPEKIVEVSRSEFKAGFTPKVGQFISVALSNNQNIMVKVTKVTDEKINLDANHALAGQNLTFEIKLIAIV